MDESIERVDDEARKLYDQFERRLPLANWEPVDDALWEIMLNYDGWPHERDDTRQGHYEQTELDLTDDQRRQLLNGDGLIIEALNQFDIRLKDEHPDMIDYVDADSGRVRIVRHSP